MKRLYLGIMLSTLAMAAIIAALPLVEVKAPATVSFSVRNSTDTGNIIPPPSLAPPRTLLVDVWIDSPPEWVDTPSGIVGYALSVRIDPRALETVGARKTPSGGGFLESFLVEYMYDLDFQTSFLVAPTDSVTGTTLDASEYILNYPDLGVGAGGRNKLMQFTFRTRSNTQPSPIDIFGPPLPAGAMEVYGKYTTADGVDHYVDAMNDGYYISETPDIRMYDFTGTSIPIPPLGSDWHELWDTYCQMWSLDSWTDNGDGILSESDQVDLTQTQGSDPGSVIWGHVDWLNPTPVPNDGKTDMILLLKPGPVPEFPLGIGVLMSLVALVPVVYVWRTRPKKKVE